MRMKRNLLLFSAPLPLLLLLGCPEDEPPPADLDPPTIDATDSPTNRNPITLTGGGKAGASVTVNGGSSPASSLVGTDGRYSVAVNLKANSTNILLVSQSENNRTSDPTQVTVVHDDMAPATPVIDPVTTPTSETSQVIRGSADLETTVSITGGAQAATGDVDASGRFAISVSLTPDSINALTVIATDEAGNDSGPAQVTIAQESDVELAAPSLAPTPSYTNQPTLAVNGSGRANLMVRVSGGVATVEAPITAEGTFSAEVELLANEENTLSVFVIDEAGARTSPPATIVVIHDDVPPALPLVAAIASPTGASIVRISGSSEASASITASIMEDGSSETAVADAAGNFALNLSLVVNSTNTIDIIATDFAMNASRPTTLVVVQDDSLPVPPQVDPVQTPTNQNPITLTGLTEVGGEQIEISGGAAAVMVNAAGDGTFTAQVQLNPNARNTLVVARTNGGASTTVIIDHDDIDPDPPTVNPIASPTNQTNIMVTGTTEPTIRVSVTGGVAAAAGNADGAGQFSVPVTIQQDATTTLTVLATDHAFNDSTAVTVMVTHSSTVPDAPVLDDENPPPTNQPMHTVMGRVTMPQPGLQIRITGGQAVAVGPTNPQDGTFDVDVPLNPNQTNTLEVRSFLGAIESPPALVTIVHDDIAPARPVANMIEASDASAPGGICIVRSNVTVTGQMSSVEGNATVRITNLDGNFADEYPATANGSFGGTQLACPAEVLEIRAIDAAGNESEPIEITIQAQ
jgi:large repetitive protein